MKVVISRTGNFIINKEACDKLGITIINEGKPDFYGWCIRNKYDPKEFVWRTDYRLVQLVEEGKIDYFRNGENISNIVVIELSNSELCLNNWTIICTDYFGEVVKLLESTHYITVPSININYIRQSTVNLGILCIKGDI
jgi:hypothetical protein